MTEGSYMCNTENSTFLFFRALWQIKKQEERDLLFKDLEELKAVQRLKMFGRPGHGAPTNDIRKKKFTEHQLGRALKRSQSVFNLDEDRDRTIVEHGVFKRNGN